MKGGYFMKIHRRGKYISISDGITATEGLKGNIPTLIIRKNGKKVKEYTGSSLRFSKELTEEDKRYLAYLAE